jgi:hypothetical protein
MKAIVYTRHCTASEASASIEDQREAIANYCAERGIDFHEDWKDTLLARWDTLRADRDSYARLIANCVVEEVEPAPAWVLAYRKTQEELDELRVKLWPERRVE